MSTANALSLGEIGQIGLAVHDVEKAAEFYRDALGLPFLFAFPGLAFFQCGTVRLMLSKPSKPEHDHPSSILYFRVDDIHAAHETLTGRGVRFEGAPHAVHKTEEQELWMAFFRDPEDNLHALMSEVKAA